VEERHRARTLHEARSDELTLGLVLAGLEGEWTLSRTPIRSLVWATDLDVLPADRVVERRDRYLVIRSPSNPAHWGGNLLLFDDPPAPGDRARWEERFDSEFAAEPAVRHRTLAWDQVDGSCGSAEQEFVGRGYELARSVGLIAPTQSIRPHDRENREVRVRALDHAPGGDEGLWEQVVALQVAGRDEREDEASHESYCRQRLEDLRALFRAGRGGWYVALEGDSDNVVASCGVVVTSGRGRYQAVETAAAHRRRGICSRLVVEAAHHAAHNWRAEQFVIAADPDYHALGLYESLGFRRREQVSSVVMRPPR
jgi:ribosomal protein S18 acetylase RimI-like enzyme